MIVILCLCRVLFVFCFPSVCVMSTINDQLQLLFSLQPSFYWVTHCDLWQMATRMGWVRRLDRTNFNPRFNDGGLQCCSCGVTRIVTSGAATEWQRGSTDGGTHWCNSGVTTRRCFETVIGLTATDWSDNFLGCSDADGHVQLQTLNFNPIFSIGW